MRRGIPLRRSLILLGQVVVGRRRLAVDLPERCGRRRLKVISATVQIRKRAVIRALTPRLLRADGRVRIVQANSVIVPLAEGNTSAGVAVVQVLMLIRVGRVALGTATPVLVVQVLVHQVSPLVV